MNRIIALALAATLMGPAIAHEGQEHEHGKKSAAAAETVKLKGEVVDMACFLAGEMTGPKHAKCAKACILGGAPAGLLTSDGSVYLLVEDHNDKKGQEAYESLKEHAGETVEVTGRKSVKGGIQGLIVKTATASAK